MQQNVSVRILIVAAVAVAATVVGCGGSGPSTIPTAPSGGLSQEARSHLDQILFNMQESSLHRLTIDWTDFRTKVYAEAGSAQTIPELAAAIRLALTLLRDGHSSYRSATGTFIFVPTRSCGAPAVPSPLLPDNIGYVRVGSFGGSGGEASQFAAAIQQAIREADHDHLLGWVVDLRGNGGGNMWPMLAGLGPLLGDGTLGYFITANGVENVWAYGGGAARVNGTVVQAVESPYRLRREQPRVAVLTDAAVASSGEATVIAFRGRPNTRSFGAPTCGLSTANQSFRLNDGATLNLTTAVMADRSKTRYGDAVTPDEVVQAHAVIPRAIDWLTGS
jgi:hypothetical protein